jgi:hypothetical protein
VKSTSLLAESARSEGCKRRRRLAACTIATAHAAGDALGFNCSTTTPASCLSASGFAAAGRNAAAAHTAWPAVVGGACTTNFFSADTTCSGWMQIIKVGDTDDVVRGCIMRLTKLSKEGCDRLHVEHQNVTPRLCSLAGVSLGLACRPTQKFVGNVPWKSYSTCCSRILATCYSASWTRR